VAEEKNADGFAAYAWHEAPFDSFLGHQANCPAGIAVGRVAADHGNDTLFLTVFQQRFGSWPLFS